MDTIITARCHLDAGGYGAKRNKAVEPDIWIEGKKEISASDLLFLTGK